MMDIKRETMDCDVLIIGAGPAGLACAIRLAQLSAQQNRPLSIFVLEKGAQVGAHILSGAIMDPSGIERLMPDWKSKNPPLESLVTEEKFFALSRKKSLSLPILPAMKNEGNYIIRLSLFCRWLSEEATKLGVHLFPGFAATQILYNENGQVIGVQTGDMGLDKNKQPTTRFSAGLNIYAKQTVFAEGCRGYLSQQLMDRFNLRAECSPQTYGIGLKEVWRVDPSQHQKGRVWHTVGWPLDHKTYGGSFIYHLDDHQVAVGFVIGLDYQNPYLNPFQEFQRFKLHPKIRRLFEGGECLHYGARALNEGGLQSIPKLIFPGGVLIGDAAGFLNVPKIKGIHNAMHSGIMAAEAILESAGISPEKPLINYARKMEQSSVYQELYLARNIRPSFRFGLWAGLFYSAFDQFIFKGKLPWTFKQKTDHLSLIPAQKAKKIVYPKPDKKITFDLLSQVFLTHTQHREDEPCHLVLKDPQVAISINYKIYDSPETRYCPSRVYEIVDKLGAPHLQINSPNCIHCKTCDIKDPTQNITWEPPEGGEGPDFTGM
jgi:electron-transferring-flavoprotein dehydrogenase